MKKIMLLIEILLLVFSAFSTSTLQVQATVESLPLLQSHITIPSFGRINLLSNPGFEDELTSWIVSPGSATYTTETTTKVKGSFSVKGAEPLRGSLGKLSQDVTQKVTPGLQYEISGWIKTQDVTGGGGAAIGLSWVDSIGYTPADGHIGGATVGLVKGTTDWTLYQSDIFTVPPKPDDCIALYFSLDFSDAAGTAWWDDLSLTGGTLVTDIDIDPNTLNLKSKGQWITAYIELPEDYDVSDIEISTVKLNGEIPAELHPTEIGDCDTDSILDLMVKFDRQNLLVILSLGEAALTITGKINGTPFEGNDTINVIGE